MKGPDKQKAAITGLLFFIAGTYLVFRTYRDLIVLLLMGIFSIGVLGVGIFPGNMNPMHPIFAMMAFVGGGLAAIGSYRIIKSPFRFVAVALGMITLIFLFTSGYFSPIMGMGGVERWVAYPVIIWAIGLGGYLLGVGSQNDPGAS